MKLKFEKFLNFFGLALLELCNFRVEKMRKLYKEYLLAAQEENESRLFADKQVGILEKHVRNLELELEGGRLTNGSNVTTIKDLKGSLSAQIRQTDAFRKALMRERSLSDLEAEAMRKKLSIANLNRREKQERLEEVFSDKVALTEELIKVRKQLEHYKIAS